MTSILLVQVLLSFTKKETQTSILLKLMGFPVDSAGKESACSARDLGLIPGSGRSLEKGMTIHSSILAWRTPWTEEPTGYSPWVCKEWDMTKQ